MKSNITLVFIFFVQCLILLLFWTLKSGHHHKDKLIQTESERFDVNERGAWDGLGAAKGHVFDEPLSNALLEFFQREKAESILDLGAGIGNYSQLFKKNGFFVSCYDGNPNTQDLSDGRCAVVDLSKVLDISPHDWVISLEVGEHIPVEFENIFMQNLKRLNKKGMIITWAIEGQGGTAHVNCRNNTYIKAKFSEYGFISDEAMQEELRSKAIYNWFKESIMVFRHSLPFWLLS